MSWTINNQTPESLNLEVTSITLNTDTASEAVLTVVAGSYTETAAFNFGRPVTIAKDGVVVFTGTVFQTPREADGSSESYEYILKDSWYDLERIVYQVSREYVEEVIPPESGQDVDSTFVKVQKFVGTTEFEDDQPLGERIRTIVSFAGSAGANIIPGNISSGITWYRTQSKDRTCAEMIREFLALMPDYVAWIDTTQGTPRFNLSMRISMPWRGYRLGTDAITNHSVIRHDSEIVPCVAIRYEKPISVDSDNYTEIIEDIAPKGATTTQVGAVIETVGLQGGVFQNEYARVTTDTIPQDGASDGAIKEWWIRYVPELAAIADSQGLGALLAVLKLPNQNNPENDVKKHHVYIVDDGIERPKPINPNATVVQQTTNVGDYPRHIIEGSLPEWAMMRYRPVNAEATMGVLKSEIDAISDESLKASLETIFNVPKTFDSKDYLTALFNAVVMGTNARTKNYKRAVTSDPGEVAPTGIAGQLLGQLNKTRFSGTLDLIGQDSDTTVKVGQILSITGGRSEWAAMGESVQQVTHNIQAGTTSLTFGPAQNLGANDLIDRLRADRANQFGFGVQSGQEIEEGIGGNSANPIFNFSTQNGANQAIHPWLVTLSGEGSSTKAKILEGKIYDGLFSITEVEPTLKEEAVTAGDIVCLEYTYASETIASKIVSAGEFEAFTDNEAQPPAVPVILTSRQPIANIIDEDGTLEVEQIMRNNLAVVDSCFQVEGEDSVILKFLQAL